MNDNFRPRLHKGKEVAFFIDANNPSNAEYTGRVFLRDNDLPYAGNSVIAVKGA
jgi:hypothetical protein